MVSNLKRSRKILSFAVASIMISTFSIRTSAASYNADVNNDGVVDKLDFEEIKKYYNQKNSKYDINADGIVDIYDMNIVTKSFDNNFAKNGYYAIGNDQSNLLNSSYVVHRNGYIYYRNTQDGNSLYVQQTNGDYKKKLVSAQVDSINVIGSKVYYRNISDSGKIYSINTNGTDNKKVLDQSVDTFLVSGGYIYYKGTDKKLYKVTVQGSNKQTIVSENVDKFTVTEELIYYTNASQGNKLYRINIYGSGNTAVTAMAVTNFDIENGVIYFVISNNILYAISVNGGSAWKIIDDPIVALNVKDNIIYYNSKSNGQLYRVNIDGTNKTAIGTEKLSTDLANAKLFVCDNWIYYTNAQDENRLYAITTDGINKKDMETPIVGIVDVSTTLSLRQGPSTSTALLAALPRNTKLDIIDRTSSNGSTWYRVIYRNGSNELMGYVSAYYIIVVNDDRMWNHLGVLSEKYESNGDPGTISNTKGDLGGKSYGAWQFSTTAGSLTTFFYWLEGENKAFFDILNAGWVADGYKNGDNFDAAWKYLAANYYKDFYNIQHKYTKMMYYDRAIAVLNSRYKVDFNTYSFAFRNAVWSTAVHHGVGGATNASNAQLPGVLSVAIEQSPAGERQIIQNIYAQRSRTEIYFSKYNPNNPDHAAILASVKNRFINECEDALQMYDYNR
ncbi:MAG: DUF5050 domain-containing protein [Clostridiales bacterium]|nr:DUF5050 domain-containing protein [Clostridiales bacterium]